MRTFFRYVAAGSVAAAAHFAVLWMLVEWFSANETVASSIGFCVATFINYSLQYHWTFRVKGPHELFFRRYVAVSTTMLGVNGGMFWCLHEMIGVHYLLAQVAATGAVMLLNFTINRRFTFVMPASCERPARDIP